MRHFLFFMFWMTAIWCVHAELIPFQSGTQEEICRAIDEFVKNPPTQKTKLSATLSELGQALQNEQSPVKVRESAAWAMGQLRDKNHVPLLLKAATDKGLLVRSAALNSLIQLRSSKALSLFEKMAFQDPVLSLRQRATLGLGLLQNEKAIQSLVKLSSDEREEIRGASTLAMAATHSKKNNFSDVLKEMRQDTSPYVQSRALVGQDIISRKNSRVLPHLESSEADIRLFSAAYFTTYGTSTELKAIQEAWAGESNDDVRQELSASVSAIKSRAAQAAAAKKKKAAAAAAAKKKSTEKK